MKNSPHTLPAAVINTFFVVGLISALSFRSLMALKDLQPEMFRLVWYVGLIGYLLFFAFRYTISIKRKRAIADYNLIPKLQEGAPLSADDRQVVSYLLSSLQKSRENLNYLFIFATSGLAIVLDILL
ncbi:MAG: hypothetical protein KQH63_18030 [Desulfobulbaceae bacterium]|nr:hypothetical protein [Desulfobulbaceae bacterium]